MKTLIALLLSSVLFLGQGVDSAYAGGKAVAAGIVGLAAGAIIGNALANRNRGGQRYGNRSSGYRQGSNGVRQLQQDLNTVGFDAGVPDGKAGRQTQSAIMQYQQAIGAPVTGSLTPQQRLDLSARAVLTSVNGAPSNNRDHWKMVQAALTVQGFSPGPIDGRPGGKTYAAIKSYQHRAGYPQTGQLNQDQLQALLNGAMLRRDASPQTTIVSTNDTPAWHGTAGHQANGLGQTQGFGQIAGTAPSATAPSGLGQAPLFGQTSGTGALAATSQQTPAPNGQSVFAQAAPTGATSVPGQAAGTGLTAVPVLQATPPTASGPSLEQQLSGAFLSAY